MKRCLVGVLGGMGPAATVDFLQKVIDCTDATSDQQHLPMLVSSQPEIPDRSSAILNGGESPLPALIRQRQQLEAAGVACIVMPCNTAHYWFEALQEGATVPLLSIIDAVVDEVRARQCKKVGILSTDATLASGLYQRKLTSSGIEFVTLDKACQQQTMEAIYCLKAGDYAKAEELMAGPLQFMNANDVNTIILGCTEIPVILRTAVAVHPDRFIDSNRALAVCVLRWHELQTGKRLLKQSIY